MDNDVNLMVLGELRAGTARSEEDVIFVKVGTGIGAGLISSGSLHRGAQGCVGDIGHVMVDEASGVICRCGKVGCLEALAGEGAGLSFGDVLHAAERGDSIAVDLITRSGRLLGQTLATLVSFFNPSPGAPGRQGGRRRGAPAGRRP